MSIISIDNDFEQVQIVGANKTTVADVILSAGVSRLATDSIVTVEEIFGQDPFPDSWFRIENTGATGNTWTITIAGTASDPSAPDVDAPLYTKVFTVLVGEVGSEIALRDRMITELNLDSVFRNTCFLKALKVRNNPIVFITSTKRGEFWNRSISGDFAVAVTGTAARTIGYDVMESKGKPTELARSPDDPRQGVLSISGSVTVSQEAIGNRYIEELQNNGSVDMQVNGSVTPVVFEIPLSATADIFINQIRLFGGGNGIQFGNFLSRNSKLTNGIKVTIKSDDITTELPLLKSTEDFKNLFSFPSGNDFRIDIQAGTDQFLAVFRPEVPFPIRAQGTFVVDDFVKIEIRDNLSSGLSQLEGLTEGFRREL